MFDAFNNVFRKLLSRSISSKKTAQGRRPTTRKLRFENLERREMMTATPAAPVFAATAYSALQINLSWNAVPGATGYHAAAPTTCIHEHGQANGANMPGTSLTPVIIEPPHSTLPAHSVIVTGVDYIHLPNFDNDMIAYPLYLNPTPELRRELTRSFSTPDAIEVWGADAKPAHTNSCWPSEPVRHGFERNAFHSTQAIDSVFGAWGENDEPAV